MTTSFAPRSGRSSARRTATAIVAGLGLLTASACGSSDSGGSTTTSAGGVASSVAAAASSAKAAAGSALSSAKAEAGSALSSAKAEAGSALSSVKSEAGSALSSAKAQVSSAVASVTGGATTAGAPEGVYTGPGPDGATWTLTFESGHLAAKGDCNTLMGSADTSTEVLKVGQMGSTMMACDDAKMAQDKAMSDFLQSNPTWKLDGDTLILSKSDQTYTLTQQG